MELSLSIAVKSVNSNAHSSRQYLYQIKPVHVFQKNSLHFPTKPCRWV